MPRNRNLDIVIEMIELLGDLVNEIRQELSYFRVSVYKLEMADAMRGKIDKLRFVAELFPAPTLLEPFFDFDAEVANAVNNYVPGECSYTARTTRLLNALEGQVAVQRVSVAKARFSDNLGEESLTSRVRQRRTELMSICHYGSRHWIFFQGL